MIIDFDIDIWWETVPAAIGDESGKVYAATPYPHCLILVMREQIAAELDMVPGNLYYSSKNGRVYDCLVGNHDSAAFPDFCLPELAGYPHSKITVLRAAPGEKPEMKLSEILEGAPTPENSERGKFASERVTVHLSPKLTQLLREYAYRYQGEHPRNIDDFVSVALLDMIERLA